MANPDGGLQNRWVDHGEEGRFDPAREKIAQRMADREEGYRELASPLAFGVGISVSSLSL